MRKNQNALTDEELAVLAAAGDDESMARLISAITPIAKAKAAMLNFLLFMVCLLLRFCGHIAISE